MSNASFNKVILIGRLGKDPDVRYSADGKAKASVTMATSESWKDKNTGERQEKTEWHNLVFFGQLAEIVGQYLRKGSHVFVEGRLQTRKWQDKNTGQDRYMTEILVNEMKMLGHRGDSGGRDSASFPEDGFTHTAPPSSPSPSYGSSAPPSYGSASNYTAAPSYAAPMPAPAPIQNTPPPRPNADLEEDIPF